MFQSKMIRITDKDTESVDSAARCVTGIWRRYFHFHFSFSSTSAHVTSDQTSPDLLQNQEVRRNNKPWKHRSDQLVIRRVFAALIRIQS